MGKIFKIAYLIFAGLFLIAWFQIRKLPAKETINPALLQEPIQAETTDRDDFSFSYRNKEYEVAPLADYELWGLVVSKNNINAWYNYYHDKDSVNLKDVCVIWGDNIKDGAYKQEQIKFKSGEFACYVGWSGYLNKPFYPNKLSNNHLLTANEAIQIAIRQVNVGDQIHIKGVLSDYKEKGSNFTRQSSLSREDENSTARAGGACEIIYIDQFNIIKHNQLNWNNIYSLRFKILGGLFIINVIWFLFYNRRRVYTK